MKMYIILLLSTKPRFTIMKGPKRLTMPLILFCLMTVVSSLALKQCQSNSDCLGNEYCYRNKHCTPCLDCSQYGQSNPPGCAKDPKDCGECLPGFQNDPQNQFNTGRKRCVENDLGHDTSTDSNKDTPKQDISNHTLLIIIFSVVGVILVFAIIGCFVVKYRVARKINEITAIPEKTNGMNDPSAPMMAPEHAINHAYSQSGSYFDDSSARDSPPAYTPGNVAAEGPRISDNFQEAIPFRPPNHITPPAVTEDHTDSMATLRPGAGDIINSPDGESTQPSPWTPTPASTDDRTTFAGILQENRNIRRHSDAENVQEQDEPPPKQPKSSNEPRYTVLNINNIINVNSSTIQTQNQSNFQSANTNNMNCFNSRNAASSNNPDEDSDNCSEDRDVYSYRSN